MMKKNKTKKKRKPLSTWEMIFCVGSLLLIMGVGIYYGYRSLYYFSKQNYRLSAEAATLYGRVTNDNTLTKDGDGFHQDTEGYYFKGNVVNNYVKYSDSAYRFDFIVSGAIDRTFSLSNDVTPRYTIDDVIEFDIDYYSENYIILNVHYN